MWRVQIALRFLRFNTTYGTRRLSVLGVEKDNHEPTDVSLDSAVVAVKTAAHDGLPFQPASLAWRDIGYSVDIVVEKKKVPKVLLNGISGAATPGKLVALMGATGGACDCASVLVWWA